MTNTAPITIAQLWRYRAAPGSEAAARQDAAIVQLDEEFRQPGATYETVMRRDRGWFHTWSVGGKQQDPAVAPERTEWATLVKALNLSQPDASTCQSTCLAMATGNRDIRGIRRRLLSMGDPGDPGTMARYVRSLPEVRYEYNGNACLEDVYGWLKAGELLITHGWFTNSGHVICLDGLRQNPDGSEAISVKDPWSEFDAPSWSYINSGVRFYDGCYSDRIIYAACVAGASYRDAAGIYRRGIPVDTKRGGMWVHRFRPGGGVVG
jgi:hypothetical protein